MSSVVEIRGERGCRIVVVVSDYERLEAEDASSDANWLRCSAAVDVGRFRGEVDAAFMTDDFVQFGAQLDQLLQNAGGEAKFDTPEEALTVLIKVDRAGRARVEGALHDLGGPTLSFSFDSDVTFLRPLRGQLADVNSRFPRR